MRGLTEVGDSHANGGECARAGSVMEAGAASASPRGAIESGKPLCGAGAGPRWYEAGSNGYGDLTENVPGRAQLRFVDLFAGLGGFHVALSRLGHECVFASEVDSELQLLYQVNFGMQTAADIRLCWRDVPPHDVLCAGFPCQPFSKAGSQLGFGCPDSGDLFDYTLKIIDRRMPRYLVLENVSNILRHAGGDTWDRITNELGRRGYSVDFRKLSPHLVGVPQVRYRAIIVASIDGLGDFAWPTEAKGDKGQMLADLLDCRPESATPLSQQHVQYLEVWEEFLGRIGKDSKMPSFPIWAMEFGANYPCGDASPAKRARTCLERYRGAFGEPLAGKTKRQQISALPTYARGKGVLPRWKVKFIEQNREFYTTHERNLRGWLPKVREFPTSFQKLEWNWQAGPRSMWDKVIQFRASGIRIKNPQSAPSLVAQTSSQVPVVGWERRYLSPRECARLQSLGGLTCLPASKPRAYKALGNAVNAEVIYHVARNLLEVGAGQGTVGFSGADASLRTRVE